MPSLGSFGRRPDQVVTEEVTTFDFLGEIPIRVQSQFNELKLHRVMALAGTIQEDDPRGLTLTRDMFSVVIHEDDLDKFWDAAIDAGMTSVERDLMPIFTSLIEVITDRPTRRPGDSSAGQDNTADSSPEGSPLVVSRGRPDLQMIKNNAVTTRELLAS